MSKPTKHDQSLAILRPEIDVNLLRIERQQLITQAHMSLKKSRAERRQLPIVEHIHMGTSIQQHAHTIVPAISAGIVQHRITRRVDGVRVGSEPQQIAQGARMAAHGRMDGRRSLESIARLNLGVVLNQQLDNLLVAELTRVHQRGALAHRVGQRVLDVAAVFDEDLDAVVVVAADGQVDWQLAAFVGLVEASDAVLVVHDDLRGHG